MDRNIAYYCIQFRSKKWYALFFMFMPDVAVQNSWLLYRKCTLYKDKPLDLLGFRREIVNVYRMKCSTQQRGLFAHHTKSPYAREDQMKTVSQQQFDMMASGIIHEAIQRKGDAVSVVKNQNMFAKNVMSHFILIVLKIMTNLRQKH